MFINRLKQFESFDPYTEKKVKQHEYDIFPTLNCNIYSNLQETLDQEFTSLSGLHVVNPSSTTLLLQAKEPKAVLKVDTMNATFQPEKIGNPNGLQITYLKDYSTRNIFVYNDSGKVCLTSV